MNVAARTDSLPVAERTSICLACRTALAPGESCDAGEGHAVASLASDAGREALVRAAWGPPEARVAEARAALHAEHAVALLAIFGFVVGLCALWLILPGVGPVHLLGAALSMAIFWGGGNLALARRGAAFPVGAPPLPAPEEGRIGLGGVALGEPALVSPASGLTCLAFAVELHFIGYWGDRVMLRDAVTCGFDVLLDDGRIARVPPGRVRLVGPMRQVVDADNLALERYLERIDLQHEAGGAFDPLRYNVVSELLLVRGDPVELVSRFEPEPSGRAPAGHYREAAPAVWVPRGTPVLRIDPR